jgi:HPt (histidine-containing phosphotransfer) domain-containing protein
MLTHVAQSALERLVPEPAPTEIQQQLQVGQEKARLRDQGLPLVAMMRKFFPELKEVVTNAGFDSHLPELLSCIEALGDSPGEFIQDPDDFEPGLLHDLVPDVRILVRSITRQREDLNARSQAEQPWEQVSLLRGHQQIALCDQLLQSIEKRYEPTTLTADFAALEARRFDRAEQCAAYFVTVQARLEEDLFDALTALRDARQRHDVEECLHRIEKTPGVCAAFEALASNCAKHQELCQNFAKVFECVAAWIESLQQAVTAQALAEWELYCTDMPHFAAKHTLLCDVSEKALLVLLANAQDQLGRCHDLNEVDDELFDPPGYYKGEIARFESHLADLRARRELFAPAGDDVASEAGQIALSFTTVDSLSLPASDIEIVEHEPERFDLASHTSFEWVSTSGDGLDDFELI